MGAGAANLPLFLVGATGVGKSAAAMDVAREWTEAGASVAILCMDAMQVYRGADIGTSKPTAGECAEFPHGGLDLVDIGENFDVAQYLAHAAEFLREQRAAGRRVIIVGGTGLYFRAMTRGLCEAPQGSDELRAELAAMATDDLRARLEGVDPGMVENLDAKNPRRLARAIEVMESTGKSLREWQAETPEPLVREFSAIWVQREKVELEQRIEIRVAAMFAQGWVDEVRGLMEKSGAEAVKRFAGIGYREIAESLGDSPVRTSTGTLQRNILVATRQYAKRQLTWFAREPSLREVMLNGNQSFSAALRAVALPSIL